VPQKEADARECRISRDAEGEQAMTAQRDGQQVGREIDWNDDEQVVRAAIPTVSVTWDKGEYIVRDRKWGGVLGRGDKKGAFAMARLGTHVVQSFESQHRPKSDALVDGLELRMRCSTCGFTSDSQMRYCPLDGTILVTVCDSADKLLAASPTPPSPPVAGQPSELSVHCERDTANTLERMVKNRFVSSPWLWDHVLRAADAFRDNYARPIPEPKPAERELLEERRAK